MLVNFVISQDKKSRIFSDIFRRYMDAEGLLRVVVSEKPIDDANVYHYHRPQMETSLSAPSVVTVHHDLEDPDPFVAYERFHARYKEADHIVCLNSLQQEFLRKNGIEHTSIIPHGYDESLFTKKPIKAYDKNRKAVFGIISKRYPRRFKGEVYLYDLLNFLPPEEVRFVLVGEGRSQDALRLESLGFEVACHEVMPYRMFPQVYDVLDFLLMVSTFEGGPANLPEAVASGTPAICTRTGMVADMIEDGQNGLILSGRVREDAARLLALLRNEDDAWDRLMKRAASVQTAPTWEEVIAAHADLYRFIATKNSSPADLEVPAMLAAE